MTVEQFEASNNNVTKNEELRKFEAAISVVNEQEKLETEVSIAEAKTNLTWTEQEVITDPEKIKNEIQKILSGFSEIIATFDKEQPVDQSKAKQLYESKIAIEWYIKLLRDSWDTSADAIQTQVNDLWNSLWITVVYYWEKDWKPGEFDDKPYEWTPPSESKKKWKIKFQWPVKINKESNDVSPSTDGKTQSASDEKTDNTPPESKEQPWWWVDAFKKSDANDEKDLNSQADKLDESQELTKEKRDAIKSLCAQCLELSWNEFSLAMNSLCVTEWQRVYFEKYLKLYHKFNEWKKSKAGILSGVVKNEKKLNNKEVSSVRDSRRLLKEINKDYKKNKKINKNLRKALFRELQSEALERQNKAILDRIAVMETQGVWTNDLPSKLWMVSRCPSFVEILADPNSQFRTMCTQEWFTHFDNCGTIDMKLITDFFECDSDDFALCPALSSFQYPVSLPAKVKWDDPIEWIYEYTPEWGEPMPVYERWNNTMLVRRFLEIIENKKQSEVDYYQQWYRPLFKEVAKRHLDGKFDFMQQLVNQWWIDEPRRNELLKICVFALIDAPVIGAMKQRLHGYHFTPDIDDVKKHRIIGEVFVHSLMSQHGLQNKKSIEDILATDLFGGSREAHGWKVPGNEKVWAIINEFVSQLPKPYIDKTNYGNADWWKKIEWKDYATLPDGRFGGVERMIDMSLTNWLIGLGVSPSNASTVAATIKWLWIAALWFTLVKWIYDNFIKWKWFIGASWRLALLWGLVIAWPRALFNKDIWQVMDFARKWDRTWAWLFANWYWPLLKKLWAKDDYNKEKDERISEAWMEVWSIFWPMKMADLPKYLSRKDGKITMNEQQYVAFMEDPSIDEMQKTFLKMHMWSLWSFTGLSWFLTRWFAASGLWGSYDYFWKFTSDDRYKNITFAQFRWMHRDFENADFGDDFDRNDPEFKARFGWLSEPEQVKAAERMKEIKDFNEIMNTNTPYIQHLLEARADLLAAAPAWSFLWWINADGAQAIKNGIDNYKKQRQITSMAYCKTPPAGKTYAQVVADLAKTATSDMSAKFATFYSSDWLEKLTNYKLTPTSVEQKEKFQTNYENDTNRWVWKMSSTDDQLGPSMLTWFPGYQWSVEISINANNEFLVFVQDKQSKKWVQYKLEKIHDFEIKTQGLKRMQNEQDISMFIDWVDNGNAKVVKMSRNFLTESVLKLVDWVTDFSLDSNYFVNNLQPNWIRDSKKSWLQRIDIDAYGKAIGKSNIVFKKTWATRP